MLRKNRRIFLDTSIVFAALLSPAGGSYKLFLLGEAGMLQLVISPSVVRECDAVVRRKVPRSLPLLAQLLEAATAQASAIPTRKSIVAARAYVRHDADARILAEAILAKPDWFVTHDKEHFLKLRGTSALPFEVGTPGDLLQRIKDELSAP